MSEVQKKRFDNIFKNRKSSEAANPEETPDGKPATPAKEPPVRAIALVKPVAEQPAAESAVNSSPSRPPGKRRDPNYVQAGMYLPKDLHRQVMKSIYGEKDLGQLVGELLERWLEDQKRLNETA